MMADSRRGAALLAALLLGACAGPPARPPVRRRAPETVVAPRRGQAGAVAAFERRQVEAATAALKQGHWADARWPGKS